MSEQALMFKHRDGSISFYPSRNELEIECYTTFKRESEEKKPFKGKPFKWKIKTNPEVMFEVYKLIKQAVEGQDIENGKIVSVRNGFRRTPFFTIGKPESVSEGFTKRKGVFALLVEDQKGNTASKFILTLGDLIKLLGFFKQMPMRFRVSDVIFEKRNNTFLGFFKQMPMRFRVSDVIFERRNNTFLMINPFTDDIEEKDIERLRIALKQFLSRKEDIKPVYIGDEASLLKKDGKFILRTDANDIEITEDIAKEFLIFLD